jgi:hypothetical protein
MEVRRADRERISIGVARVDLEVPLDRRAVDEAAVRLSADHHVPVDRGAVQIGEQALVAGVVGVDDRADPDPDLRSR